MVNKGTLTFKVVLQFAINGIEPIIGDKGCLPEDVFLSVRLSTKSEAKHTFVYDTCIGHFPNSTKKTYPKSLRTY